MDKQHRDEINREVSKIGLSKFIRSRTALMLDLYMEANNFIDDGGLDTAESVCALIDKNIDLMKEIKFLFCGDED